MSEPELAFTRKTFDDTFGRHALVHAGPGGAALPMDDRIDVNHLLPPGAGFNPTRLYADYQPRHAQPENPVADRNTDTPKDEV